MSLHYYDLVLIQIANIWDCHVVAKSDRTGRFSPRMFWDPLHAPVRTQLSMKTESGFVKYSCIWFHSRCKQVNKKKMFLI